MADLGEQHNDHIWLTFAGEGWAIHSILHNGESAFPIGTANVLLVTAPAPVFNLWRGYDAIEIRRMSWPKYYWPRYARRAAKMLEGQE